MATLRETIDALADDFASRILRAVRHASLEELRAETHTRRGGPPKLAPRAPGARVRRSPAELARLADFLVALVKKEPNGIRAEDLKHAMGVPPGNIGAKAFTKPLSIALASGRIKKRGARRATVYSARS